MENNWRDKVKQLIKNNCTNCGNCVADLYEFEELVDITLIIMDLVFEATKKECADKAEMTGIAYGNNTFISDYEIDKDSILNINKPNL